MTSSSKHTFGALVGLTAAYVLAQWPALTDAWWYCDDYAHIANMESPFVRACQNGRPLEGLWMATLRLDSAASAWAANIMLRLVQAAAHIAVAVLGGAWLARVFRRQSLVLASALFLLWPLHTEAVLWRTAGSYPLGALMGILALYLAWPASGNSTRGRLTAACLLLAAAALTNQTSSMIVWVLPGIAVLGRAAGFGYDKRVLLLMASHSMAALVSIAVTLLPEFATARATLSVAPLEKVALLRRLLSHVWFWRGMYPVPLVISHGLLAASVLLGVRFTGVRARAAIAWAVGALVLCALPFAPALLVRENSAMPRVMYLGPWLSVAALVVLLRQAQVGSPQMRAIRRWMTLAGITGTLISYTVVGREVAQEYIALFRAEQHVLANAERVALDRRAHGVAVEEVNPRVERNHMHHRAARDSALQVPYAVEGRVTRFSQLTMVRSGEVAAAASRAGERARLTGDFHVVFDPTTQCVLVLQPR